MNSATDPATSNEPGNDPTVMGPADGEPLTIGRGFSARSFRARDLGPAMDPLVLVDHYVMTEPTFGTHPHAGLSAVSLIFEDSEGRFHNRDSLGNDFDLLPGDLYWLKAGRGAVHNEEPRSGSRIHGLQVFVNVPQDLRYEEPSSLLVRRQDMPLLSDHEYSVHIAMGESNGVVGATSPALPMTILDGRLTSGGNFEHELSDNQSAWIHAIDGELCVDVLGITTKLRTGQATAINPGNGGPTIVTVSASNDSNARFALFGGQMVREPYVQQGPFVMGSKDEIDAANRAFDEGRFGSID